MKIVIKVGTSTLYDEKSNVFLQENFENLCKQIADLMKAGHDVVLVTSGACGLGRMKMINNGMKLIEDAQGKQVLINDKDELVSKAVQSTVGQGNLMGRYEREFEKYNITIGQTLLAGKHDFKKKLTHSLFNESFQHGLLQIVNANDAVYDEQLKIGDNDTLSAEVAKIIKADKLLLVTDIEGFYENFGTKQAAFREEIAHKEIKSMYRHVDMNGGSSSGTGKMKTKLDAAQIATKNGIDTNIVSNNEINNLSKLISGDTNIRLTHFSKAKASKLIEFCEHAIKTLKERVNGCYNLS